MSRRRATTKTSAAPKRASKAQATDSESMSALGDNLGLTSAPSPIETTRPMEQAATGNRPTRSKSITSQALDPAPTTVPSTTEAATTRRRRTRPGPPVEVATAKQQENQDEISKTKPTDSEENRRTLAQMNIEQDKCEAVRQRQRVVVLDRLSEDEESDGEYFPGLDTIKDSTDEDTDDDNASEAVGPVVDKGSVCIWLVWTHE
jgi:hypothetical protein